jgi:hypothetical protein
VRVSDGEVRIILGKPLSEDAPSPSSA